MTSATRRPSALGLHARVRLAAPLTAALALVACTRSPDESAASRSTTKAPTPTAPAPSISAPAPTAAPAASSSTLVEGATCPAGTQRVTDVPIAIDGETVRFTRDRGGGCPERPVYTVHYTRADPMPVLVCFDQRADPCEMMMTQQSVALDVGPALRAVGATRAILAP